jgi:5-methylcytosine-specific restriction protein A
MPLMPPSHRPRGGRERRERERAYDQARGTAAERGYDSKWQRARVTFLAQHPLCIMCEREQRVAAATVVDHIIPHRGDRKLFWSRSNWQPLCKPHHDRAKQAEERAARRAGA